MFADELAMLTRQFEDRLKVVHFHSRPGAGTDETQGECEHLVPGRLDAPQLATHLDDPRLRDAEWFLCGPPAAIVTITHAGRHTDVRTQGTASILEAPLDGGVAVPYLCTGGICGTCRATVTSGTVHVQQNYALSDDDVERGEILTCQSRPASRSVKVDYDR